MKIMKTHRALKLLFASLVPALALPFAARADFNPVELTPDSYTYDIVVESNATPYFSTDGSAVNLKVVNAFIGSGTNFGDATLYEQGMHSPAGYTGYNSGIPVHGTVFTNINNPNMTFVMPSTYQANEDLMIVNNSSYGHILTGTLTFASPLSTNVTKLAILDTGGNGGCTVSCVVNRQDGSTSSVGLPVPDWFNTSGFTYASTVNAWGCNGRVYANGYIDHYNSSSVNNNAPYLDAQTISLPASTSAVVSVTFNYNSGSGISHFFAVSASTDGTTFTPVPINGGFNKKTIVPAFNPFPVTATMDRGTNLSDAGNTWFEQGYYSNNVTDGLPSSGSIFSSISQPTHHYQMGNYSANNAILIDTNHQSANLVLASPKKYTGIALLTAGGDIGGNNVMTNLCILQHEDGVNETNVFYGYDWFNTQQGGALAYQANGRIYANSRDLNNLGNTFPYLFETYFTLSDLTSPVTNIVVNYKTAPGANSTTYIMAVSATTNAIAPIITQQPLPTNQVLYAGQTATISVLTAGSQPLTNSWLVESNGTYVPLSDGTDGNGSVISGSGTMTLSIGNVTLADATNYKYIASNAAGSVTSMVASVTIRTGIAGVVPMSGWNNIKNTTFIPGNSTNIYSSDGSNVATLTLSGNQITNGYNSGITGDGGNGSLMDGYMDIKGQGGGTADILISGLPGSTYDIYLYTFPDQTRPSSATDGLPNYTINGTTIYYVPTLGGTGASTYNATSESVGGTGFSGFILGTTTNANDFAQDVLVSAFGNYIEITNVAVSGSQIDIQGGQDTTSFRSPLNGIELVDTSSGQTFGIHFLGNTGEQVNGTPVLPIIDSQFPANSFTVLTNHIVTTTFSVTVDGSSTTPLYYQWYRVLSGNVTNAIPNATGTTYANVDTNNETLFCIVSNSIGTAMSTPVSISIVQPPAPTPYQTTVLSYNPVSYWPLNETNGYIAYDYAGTNDGVYHGNYQLGQAGLPASAGIGSNTSVYFDGSSAYVDIPNSANNGQLDILGPITVVAWVKVPNGGEPNFGTIAGHSDKGYRMSVISDNGGEPRFADAGPDAYDSNLTINDGKWHILAGVFDGGTEYIYVDGQLADSELVTSYPIINGSDLLIGAAPDYLGSRNFQGNIAQVAVYDKALTMTQLDDIYSSLDTAPQVSVAPVNPTIYSGESVTLTASVSGTPATSYQWYYIDTSNNSNNIAGATGSTYTVANVPAAYSGYTFGVIAANAYGTNTASTTLSVSAAPPTLVGDIKPLNSVAYAGAPATYTVSVQGSLPISYQWIVNGTNVVGATNASFTLPTPCGANTIQVSFTNAYSGGSPTYSSPANLQGDSSPTNITFNIDGTGWIGQGNGVSGVPTIATNVLTLTDGTGGEASSAFYQYAQYVGSFAASFTYTAGGNMQADGSCFILQNSPTGPNALGGTGGALGYYGISNSVALEINLYSVAGIAFGTNGATYSNGGGSSYQPTGNISVSSGHPIDFNLNYVNGVLGVTMKDETTLETFSTNYVVGPLTPILGSSLAYVGFSGGDGGLTSIQSITNFVFTPVITPESLSATPEAGGKVIISWPATDPNYILQVSPSLSSPSWANGPTPTMVNGHYQVTFTPVGTEFYRLIHVGCQ